MKFKAILTDQLCMKDLHNIVSTFARLSKRATFNVKRNGLYLSNVAMSISSNPLMWAIIEKDDFFAQFAMEGVDEQHNEIWLSFYPEQLASALNTLKNFVKIIKIKLTKKQFPCLSIDIEMAPPNSNNFRRLVHDVPVTIISSREWNEYGLPATPTFNISVQLPSLKSLRTLSDKMKNLSPSLTICCGPNGDLSFIVETDSAMVVSRYYNLTLEGRNIDHVDENGEQAEISCQICTKQLSNCFASIQFQNIKMIGNMVQDDLLNIKINVRDKVVMFCNIHTVDAT